ncbi:protein of unknown function [Polaribacter sp. KT25b]|uniref:DUF3857 domain-containing protein n=1 Tax=Polaribacter sp. KT25b TaxID=1855336 RepID=UPI00087A6718|nr:DUF3857 domain-containing protein [Polaribacter sp. KT25b]SDR68782.1 protein of unknown function [Polaribacter sp. KT25b]
MIKKIAFTLFVFTQLATFAQDYKFGKVSKEELQEKFYPLDSTADAAYLYRSRNTYYEFLQREGRFQIVTEIHERIKIYNKEGFNYGTKLIPFYNPEGESKESVSSIKGYTFSLLNGKVEKTKLAKKNIFEEKRNKYRSEKKITMPSIKEGSVIEIQYTLTSPYTRTIDDLVFQYNIPVKKLDYEVTIPEYYVFSQRTKGYHSIIPNQESKSKNLTYTIKNIGRPTGISTGAREASNTTYSYEKFSYEILKLSFNDKNIPALKNNEPFVNNINNYRGGMEFEIKEINFTKLGGDRKFYSSDWTDVSKEIFRSSSFGSELDKSSFYKDDLNSLSLEGKSDMLKVATIFQFVKSRVKWNGYYDKYTYNGVKKAYKERVGNVADINLMLTSMLRFAGLDANPVLVSSRGNGIPLFPTIKGFDYVIAAVTFKDNTYVLLDATEPYSLPNILPERALNWDGRLVKKDGNSSWINLTSEKHSLEENMIMIKINNELVTEGYVRTKFDNLKALDFRRSYNHIKEESLITNFEENNNVEITDFKIQNKVDLSKPIVRMIKFSSNDLIEGINGKLYIEPLLFLTKHNNPFKLEERKFPIDFTASWKELNRVTIEIPLGYKVEKLPEVLAIALPDNMGVFKYQVSQVGNKIKAISVLQFNKPLIGAQYYKDLKDFFDKTVSKQSEKIVLIKE